MSIEYDIYLTTHKENVIKGFEWIKQNLSELVGDNGDKFLNLVYSHDSSKTKKDEYNPYDEYFYGKNKSAKVVEEFNKAWLRHIHRNPHHWQYWVLINDDHKTGMNAIEMPYGCVIEMICDWWAFSWDKGDLTEIFKWYDKHKSYMILHTNTRRTVEMILEKIKTKLEALNADIQISRSLESEEG